MSSFFDERAAAAYLDGPPRQVPGYTGLLRMTTLLLAEHIPTTGRVLVLGAGGGLELKSMAEAHPDWTFTGVDPSPSMLELAAQTTAPHAARIQLHEGYIDTAPQGPFDAATCLLTLHFVPADQRLATLQQLRTRLQPGAPLVVAHLSVPLAERALWLARHVAFGSAEPPPPAQLERSVAALDTRLTILDPAEDEDLLVQAGFTGVSLFHLGFSIRGWVAYAA
ncbi:class I SAM-dependent methyltransferase [Devosia sp. A449]